MTAIAHPFFILHPLLCSFLILCFTLQQERRQISIYTFLQSCISKCLGLSLSLGLSMSLSS